MEKMADLLLSHSIKPVFMNLPPIDGERYYRWISSLKDTDPKAILKWLGGQTDTIYRQQERYSRAMERVAYQKNLPLIDVRDEFLAIHNYRDYLCSVSYTHLDVYKRQSPTRGWPMEAMCALI